MSNKAHQKIYKITLKEKKKKYFPNLAIPWLENMYDVLVLRWLYRGYVLIQVPDIIQICV